MSGAVYAIAIVLAWFALLAAVVAIFHAQRWIEDAIEEEMNAIAPAPCGPRQETREER